MKKALLVLDNYPDQKALQSLLMKFGWDVKVVKRDQAVPDELLVFSPDLLISSIKTKSIDGLKIARCIQKESRPLNLVLVCEMGESKRLSPVYLQYIILEKPLIPPKILMALSKVTGEDYRELFKRYQSLMGIPVGGGDSSQTLQKKKVTQKPQNPQRHEKYQAILESENFENLTTFDSSRIHREVAERKASGDGLQELDKEKKKFVEALFSKKNKISGG